MQKLKLDLTDSQAKKLALKLVEGFDSVTACDCAFSIIKDIWLSDQTSIGSANEDDIEMIIYNYQQLVIEHSPYVEDIMETAKTHLIGINEDTYGRHLAFMRDGDEFSWDGLVSATQFETLKSLCTTGTIQPNPDDTTYTEQVLVHPDYPKCSYIN